MEVFFLGYRKTQLQKIWQQNDHGPWNFIYFQPDACVQFKATCEFQLVEPVWVNSLLDFVCVTYGSLVCGVSAQTARVCVNECVCWYTIMTFYPILKPLFRPSRIIWLEEKLEKKSVWQNLMHVQAQVLYSPSCRCHFRLPEHALCITNWSFNKVGWCIVTGQYLILELLVRGHCATSRSCNVVLKAWVLMLA